MKKLYLILIIAGSIVIVATPSIWLGIHFYAQNRIENTDVSIENFVITNLTNTTMGGIVNFTISEPTKVDASFRITDFNLSYTDIIVGSGIVAADSLSAKDPYHLVDFSLDITNAALFDTLIDDFINELTLEIDIDVNVEFLGALSSLPNKLVSKTVEMNGFAGVSLDLLNFHVTSAIGESLELNFWVDVYNPTPVEVNLSSVTGDIITMNHTKIGYFIFPNFEVESGSNYINVITSINGAKSEIGDILGTYVSGIDQTLLLNYTLVCDTLNGLVIEETYAEFDFLGCDIDLVEIDVEMITLSVEAPASVS